MPITKLKGDSEGGLLDNLLNKGKMPDVNVTLSTQTLKELGLMLASVIIVSAIIIIIVNAIFKTLTK